MKTTNEKIADLVARGFVLPDNIDGHWYFCNRRMSEQKAYDLIACEFARQAFNRAMPVWSKAAMSDGDTEAAINALWEATQ